MRISNKSKAHSTMCASKQNRCSFHPYKDGSCSGFVVRKPTVMVVFYSYAAWKDRAAFAAPHIFLFIKRLCLFFLYGYPDLINGVLRVGMKIDFNIRAVGKLITGSWKPLCYNAFFQILNGFSCSHARKNRPHTA